MSPRGIAVNPAIDGRAAVALAQQRLNGRVLLLVLQSITAARFMGEAADPRTIASEADVDVIVTGTLLRAGDELRVTSQLTDQRAYCPDWLSPHRGR